MKKLIKSNIIIKNIKKEKLITIKTKIKEHIKRKLQLKKIKEIQKYLINMKRKLKNYIKKS